MKTSFLAVTSCVQYARHSLRSAVCKKRFYRVSRICNTRCNKASAFKDEIRFFFSDTRSRLGHTWAWQGNYGSSLDFRYINRTRNYHEWFPVSFFRLRVAIDHFHPHRWIILSFCNSAKLAMPLFPQNETNAPGRRKYFSQYTRAELLLSRDHANIFLGRRVFAGNLQVLLIIVVTVVESLRVSKYATRDTERSGRANTPLRKIRTSLSFPATRRHERVKENTLSDLSVVL